MGKAKNEAAAAGGEAKPEQKTKAKAGKVTKRKKASKKGKKGKKK